MPFSGAVIVGGAALAGAAISANASGKAASAQSKSANSATEAQLQMYNQTRDDQAPARALGNSALAALGYGSGLQTASAATQTEPNFDAAAYLKANPDLAGSWYQNHPYQHYLDYGQSEGRAFAYTPQAQSQLAALSPGNNSTGMGAGDLTRKFTLADYQQDPGYQFRLDQGSQALERSAAARGGLLSGGTLKDLTNYQQGAASQEYGAAYNRFNQDQSNRFARLATLAGFGSAANNVTANAGTTTAGNIGNNIIGAGNAQAAGYVGAANGVNNSISQGLSSYNNTQLLNRLVPQQTNYGYGGSGYTAQPSLDANQRAA